MDAALTPHHLLMPIDLPHRPPLPWVAEYQIKHPPLLSRDPWHGYLRFHLSLHLQTQQRLSTLQSWPALWELLVAQVPTAAASAWALEPASLLRQIREEPATPSSSLAQPLFAKGLQPGMVKIARWQQGLLPETAGTAAPAMAVRA